MSIQKRLADLSARVDGGNRQGSSVYSTNAIIEGVCQEAMAQGWHDSQQDPTFVVEDGQITFHTEQFIGADVVARLKGRQFEITVKCDPDEVVHLITAMTER